MELFKRPLFEFRQIDDGSPGTASDGPPAGLGYEASLRAKGRATHNRLEGTQSSPLPTAAAWFSKTGSRYTRHVSWRRPIGFVVLAILTALPVSGAVCAILCDSASSSAAIASGHHHGSSHSAEAPARSSTDDQISGFSEHDCRSHDGALRLVSTTAAERTSWGVTWIALVLATVPATFEASTALEHREYGTPPGTAPPPTTPRVLRV